MSKKSRTAKKIAGLRRAGQLSAARKLPTIGARMSAELGLVKSWFPHPLLEDEAFLQEQCWIQYRYISPLERTELFARTYIEIYKQLLPAHFPDKDVTKCRPAEEKFACNDLGVMTALWTARAAADSLGTPYDLYIKTIMEGHMVNDCWKRPPRPNQMYGKLAKPRTRALIKPDEELRRLCASDWDPRFRAENYVGDPVQEELLARVKRLVNTSEKPAEVLAIFLGERQAMTRQQAVDIFGEELAGKAEALSALPPAASRQRSRVFVPSCFGLISTVENAPCEDCLVRSKCSALDRVVREELIRTVGSADPRREQQRKANAERQRRFRAKKRRGRPRRTG